MQERFDDAAITPPSVLGDMGSRGVGVSWRGGQAFRRSSTGEDLDLAVGLAAETDESAGQMAVAVFHFDEIELPPSLNGRLRHQTRSATPTGITVGQTCRAAWGGRSALA